MSVFTVQRLATPEETAAEMDRRGAVIEKLEANLRHWRDECGKLHAQIAALKAAAPSDGMVEALRTIAGSESQNFDTAMLRAIARAALSTKGAAPSVSDELVKAPSEGGGA